MDQAAIVAALKAMGASQVAVARLLGISADKVSKAFKGTRRFTAEETLIIMRFLGVEEELAPARLPIIGLVPAGTWREAIKEPLGWMPKPDASISDMAFVVKVEGDSMDEVAPDGTHLIVDPTDRQLATKAFYIIRNGDGDVTFKQFLTDPARLVPRSSNPAHQPIIVGDENFEIVGRVVMKAEWL